MERGRFLRLASAARCRPVEKPLPTAAALVEAKRTRLAKRIEESIGANLALPPVFAALAKEHGAEQVLAALVHRLVPDAPPEKAAPAPVRAPAGARVPMIQLMVALGGDDGVMPGQLVAMLCRVPGLTGADIGKIRCDARFSSVEIRADRLAVVMAARLHHRGRPVAVRVGRR
jgi:hypothetical protein